MALLGILGFWQISISLARWGVWRDLEAILLHKLGALFCRSVIPLINLTFDRPTAANLQGRVTPIYEEMDGWSESTAGARSWADLPGAAIKYVRRIEELIQCPVALLSTSPEREDTILVTDPFAD